MRYPSVLRRVLASAAVAIHSFHQWIWPMRPLGKMFVRYLSGRGVPIVRTSYLYYSVYGWKKN